MSFALSAFFAGVVLGESDLSHQAAADSLPLQDAFAVLFLVSVGMLFDPSILVRQPLAMLAVVMLIVLGKPIATFAIVLARGYPVTTAFTVSASLAQIGEFSFILTGLGIMLGLLPSEGRDLILAGAILSIALNPLVFATVDPVAAWIRERPGLNGLVEGSGNPLATLPEKDRDTGWRDHAIIVGYGRVGEIIGGGLKAQGLPFVVVDEDRRRVEELRKRGPTAIYGDATAAGVLEATGVDRARLLILAIPQGFQKRRIIELARQTHRASELAISRTRASGSLSWGRAR